MTKPPETVVVTGGTAGIGRATAREFARHGCNVAVLARGQDGLDATKRDIEELGGKALAIPTDVADWKAVEAAADQVERELGSDRHLGQQRLRRHLFEVHGRHSGRI